VFKADANYVENEEKYKAIKAEILGEDSDEDSGSEEEGSEESDDEGMFSCHFWLTNKLTLFSVAETKEGIEDRTETNLVNLRRIIYLTIMNALNYEEAVHKLLKVQLEEGQEVRFIFFLSPLFWKLSADWNGEHDYRVLLTRTVLFDILWANWWAFQ